MNITLMKKLNKLFNDFLIKHSNEESQKSWLELMKIDGLTPNSIINPQGLSAIKDLYLEKRLRNQVRAKLK